MKVRLSIIVGIVLLGVLVAVAYFRSGLLNLPDVPGDLNIEDAGLAGLEQLKSIDDMLNSGKGIDSPNEAVKLAATGMADLENGNEAGGLQKLHEAVKLEPTNMVIGNALRMGMFRLKRKWLAENASRSEIALRLPDYLQDEPAQFFRELDQLHPAREVRLQLALALVDHMLLFPALEIKAPASVEAVEILTKVLNGSNNKDAYYVPALYGRGLNYLYRPFNLVWPERIASAPDAASKDIALAVAVGQKSGAGSGALKGELSLALGDAYAKEGKLNLARSWWQIANNLAHDDKFRERVFLRLKWEDDDVRSNLEETLQRQMEDLDHPLSDLRFMWK